MMISAYIVAGRVLGIGSAVAFALKSLDRILSRRELGHVVAYPESRESGERVAGGLEDHVFTGHAALDAWEATGEMRYFEAGLRIGAATVAKFYDRDKGGFFDTEMIEGAVGALTTRRKPLQDSPSPGGNPVAASLLTRLAELTSDVGLRERAKATLECFAGVVEHLGLHCASYALALRRLTLPPIQVVVAGNDAHADELERAALKGYAVNKSVLRIRDLGPLPPGLGKTIPHLPPQPGSFAVVCRDSTCGFPLVTVAELLSAL